MIKNILILVILGFYASIGSALPQTDINYQDSEANQSDQANINLDDHGASWARGRGGRGGHRHGNRNGHHHGNHRDRHGYNGHNRGGHDHDDNWRGGRHRDHRKSWNTRGMTGYSSSGGGYEGGYAGENAYVEEFPVAQGVIQPVVQAPLAPAAQPAPVGQPAPVAQPIL